MVIIRSEVEDSEIRTSGEARNALTLLLHASIPRKRGIQITTVKKKRKKNKQHRLSHGNDDAGRTESVHRECTEYIHNVQNSERK